MAADTLTNSDRQSVTFTLDTLESALHASRSEWLFCRELRLGVGRRNSSSQRLDAFALNCLPHQAMRRVCYEVKLSRADFLCEMRNPVKRRMGLRFSNEFYFVTPTGMLSSSEVPVECGLIEIGCAATEDGRTLVRSHPGLLHLNRETDGYCILAVQAPWRDTPGPTWQFAAAIARNQMRRLSDDPLPWPKQAKLSFE